MNIDEINTAISKDNINLVKMKTNEIYNVILNDCISDIVEYKWSSMSKKNFLNSLTKLNDELIDYLNLLDKANESMNQVSIVQKHMLEIKNMKQENIILKTSTNLEDKSKLIKNEQEIKEIEDKIKNIENLLIQNWR